MSSRRQFKWETGKDYRGFWVSKTGGPDAPWVARHEDGRKVRADTLAGVKGMIEEEELKVVTNKTESVKKLVDSLLESHD